MPALEVLCDFAIDANLTAPSRLPLYSEPLTILTASFDALCAAPSPFPCDSVSDMFAFDLTPEPFFRGIKLWKDGGAVDRGGLENR